MKKMNLEQSVVMFFKVVLWAMIVLVCSNIKFSMAVQNQLSAEEHLELDQKLKELNKSPIKTYKTEEGDIIDCIDINKQPALDHPLLTNHKIQTSPSTFPITKGLSKSKHLPFKTTRKPCPTGTVPIRRTQKDDLIRAKSQKPPHLIPNPNFAQPNSVTFPSGQSVVSLSMKVDVPYYGGVSYMSVYNLSIAEDQSSSTNLWVIGGPPQQLNAIIAGWQVNHAVNGDGLSRMFLYWTSDASVHTGCYNMLCKGFIQINPQLTPDIPLSPTSYTGSDQYDIKIFIFQDRPSGNWWFAFGESGRLVGYLPKELFPHIADGAGQVAWGGIAKAGGNGISPPLGNGNKPDPTGNFRLACYIRKLNFVNGDNEGQSPEASDLQEYVGDSNCYGLLNCQDCGFEDELYYCFLFGGPGGKCNKG